MKIDISAHISPERYYKKLVEKAPLRFYMDKRWKGIPCLTDLGKRFEIRHEFDDYVQVLTLSFPPLEAVVGPDDTPELARIVNDELGKLVTTYPDRVSGSSGLLSHE